MLPPGHRLARSGHDVTLTDLADETWVGGGPASAWFRIVRHTCRAAGFDPRVALTTDDSVAVQAFAAAGLGVAVIPGLAACTTCRSSKSGRSAGPRRSANLGRTGRRTRSAPRRHAS